MVFTAGLVPWKLSADTFVKPSAATLSLIFAASPLIPEAFKTLTLILLSAVGGSVVFSAAGGVVLVGSSLGSTLSVGSSPGFSVSEGLGVAAVFGVWLICGLVAASLAVEGCDPIRSSMAQANKGAAIITMTKGRKPCHQG